MAETKVGVWLHSQSLSMFDVPGLCYDSDDNDANDSTTPNLDRTQFTTEEGQTCNIVAGDAGRFGNPEVDKMDGVEYYYASAGGSEGYQCVSQSNERRS